VASASSQRPDGSAKPSAIACTFAGPKLTTIGLAQRPARMLGWIPGGAGIEGFFEREGLWF
jgi:hypothetical protein